MALTPDSLIFNQDGQEKAVYNKKHSSQVAHFWQNVLKGEEGQNRL